MDQTRLEKILIPPVATVRKAIESIDAGAIEIALVVDDERRLLGTVTDGDVRRALLDSVSLDDPIEPIIHRRPIVAPQYSNTAELLRLMTEHCVDQVPLIDEGRVADVALIRDILRLTSTEREGDSDQRVVLIAGGRGSRLNPLTAQTPKAMLPVGDRPLLERALVQVREAGFSRVLIAVNYRAEVIEEHFGDGSGFGVDIAYLREDEPLGSAGALRLAGAELEQPFLVMNADLLTNVNLVALMRFHCEEGNALTIGVRQYALEVPYGVVALDSTRVVSLREKPTETFFINAGIYAVDPRVVSLMPAGEDRPERFDMTELIDAALRTGLRVGGFPIREYWLDIGHITDYERAETDYVTHFSSAP